MKVYISGAISGHDKNNVKDKFASAADYLKQQGHEPLNPFDNGLPDSASWADHMRADIKMMMDAELVLMLPCWVESRGAKIELDIAQRIGLPVTHFDRNDKF